MQGLLLTRKMKVNIRNKPSPATKFRLTQNKYNQEDESICKTISSILIQAQSFVHRHYKAAHRTTLKSRLIYYDAAALSSRRYRPFSAAHLKAANSVNARKMQSAIYRVFRISIFERAAGFTSPTHTHKFIQRSARRGHARGRGAGATLI